MQGLRLCVGACLLPTCVNPEPVYVSPLVLGMNVEALAREGVRGAALGGKGQSRGPVAMVKPFVQACQR